jgi:hypothetical protein
LIKPVLRPSFADALGAIASERSYLVIGKGGRYGRPIAEIAQTGILDRWLSSTQSSYQGMDRRSAGAYLFSIFVWRLGEILGAAYLMGAGIPGLDAENVQADQFGPANAAGEPDYGFGFTANGSGKAFDPATVAASLVAIHAPLVGALHARTGLSQGALWRLATDGITHGLLLHARRHGDVEAACAAARAICAAPPLYNKQWHFADIALRHGPQRVRMRGGCCRLYRASGHRYCSTCVVLPEPTRIARILEAERQQS